MRDIDFDIKPRQMPKTFSVNIGPIRIRQNEVHFNNKFAGILTSINLTGLDNENAVQLVPSGLVSFVQMAIELSMAGIACIFEYPGKGYCSSYYDIFATNPVWKAYCAADSAYPFEGDLWQLHAEQLKI